MSTKQSIDIEMLMERVRSQVALRPKGVVSGSAPHYALGTLLRFGTGGNAGPHTGTGWSHPEPEFRWTDGEFAELSFVFEKVPGDLILSFTAHPLIGKEVEFQEVSALWNGVPVGEWSVREAKSYHTIIMSHVSAGSPGGLLRFEFPSSFSLLSKNLGSDPRRLGLAFHELVLRPALELGF